METATGSGFNGQELENEAYNLVKPIHKFGKMIRFGREGMLTLWSKQESPYVTFSDNPMLYIDPGE